jgi:pimeloyl-ACP methyl ester carboxylesterase
MSLPSLLLVAGAWHRPEHLRLLMNELSGIDVHTVALTSSGDDPAVLGDMYADAEVIAAAVAAIDGPVVVAAHSYGAIPVTQALADVSNVPRIVFLTSYQLDAGESLLSSVGGSPVSWVKMHQQEGIGDYIEAMTPADVFYGDVDAATAQQAVSQLGYQSLASMIQEVTEVAWKTVPSTYIICEADNAVPPSLQERFAQRAEKVQRLNTSHAPFLSQPAALAQLIRDELASA